MSYTPSQIKETMQSHNPSMIPRNHHVQYVLESAQQGDLSPMHHLLHALKAPYDYNQAISPFHHPPKDHERVYQTFCGT